MAPKNATETHTLTDQECRSFVEFVREYRGGTLSSAEFAEVALGLFEDVPGFESIRPNQADRIVRQLWSTYCEQKDPQT